jgi:uncharacterized protein (DUF4415 family)
MNKLAKNTIDPELAAFEDALLTSISQAKLGEGRVTTPAQITSRQRGRPVGSTKATPKIPTTIRFDQDVLDALKASGSGWQTRVNEAMRDWLKIQSKL